MGGAVEEKVLLLLFLPQAQDVPAVGLLHSHKGAFQLPEFPLEGAGAQPHRLAPALLHLVKSLLEGEDGLGDGIRQEGAYQVSDKQGQKGEGGHNGGHPPQ